MLDYANGELFSDRMNRNFFVNKKKLKQFELQQRARVYHH